MKIYVDMPHGCGQDRGANKIVNEEIYSDEMISLVVAKLRALGHEVLAQRPSGNLTVQQSMNWRCQQANSWGADIFISNHNNAGGGYGAEVYTHNGEKIDEAVRYLQYIINIGGSVHDNDRKNPNAGIKNGSGFAVINGTSMKAMLVENFYTDTQSDIDFYNNNKEMFANALVYGITGTFVDPKVKIDEMSHEGNEEVNNKITVYAASSNPSVYYKFYYELNGEWTTCTNWQEDNKFSFMPKTPGTYKVVCHVKHKSNTTDTEDAYNYINIEIKPSKNIYEMKVNSKYYGQTYYNDIAVAVEKEMAAGAKEITLIRK
ncbi:MAG: N-acetylmuramoyl-L-alanine amidase [Terrisporobacter sp.]